ncbi:MAG: SH3 domain-containing protein [Candidatus Electrothrix sp. ATG1]|nr:SH3 domain-containing protein [Candidatus Electrothrix sp. ATG1]
MWCTNFISSLIIFWILFSTINPAYGTQFGQIKMNGDSYVSMTENPTSDSFIIGWIPEGDFVKILSGPFTGTLDKIPVKWHKVEYKNKEGFTLSHLLDFYKWSSKDDEKDIAQIKINGNGFINVRTNSSIDSPVIGCIPEGKIVKLLSDPILGYIGDKSGYWYKVEHKGTIGFIWETLLNFYTLSPQQQDSIITDSLSEEKKLAEMVMEMIKNGQKIVFTYKDGKLSLAPATKNDWEQYYNNYSK